MLTEKTQWERKIGMQEREERIVREMSLDKWGERGVCLKIGDSRSQSLKGSGVYGHPLRKVGRPGERLWKLSGDAGGSVEGWEKVMK